MCFSPEVDALAGLVVGAVAIDAVRHVRRPSDRPLAALPVIFAAHQLVEALVWWSLQGRLPEVVGYLAVLAYLVGNHEGKVLDLWILGIEVVMILILVADHFRRKNAWRSR